MESDYPTLERRGALRADLADKEEQLRSLEATWESQRAGLNRVGELKTKLDELRSAAERAQRDTDLETASRQIGRASCRERGELPAGRAPLKEERRQRDGRARTQGEDNDAAGEALRNLADSGV